MNEIDEAALAALIKAHGVGDLLMAVARHCVAERNRTCRGVRYAKWDLCATLCSSAARAAADTKA